jgi:hypothetical protein
MDYKQAECWVEEKGKERVKKRAVSLQLAWHKNQKTLGERHVGHVLIMKM